MSLSLCTGAFHGPEKLKQGEETTCGLPFREPGSYCLKGTYNPPPVCGVWAIRKAYLSINGSWYSKPQARQTAEPQSGGDNHCGLSPPCHGWAHRNYTLSPEAPDCIDQKREAMEPLFQESSPPGSLPSPLWDLLCPFSRITARRYHPKTWGFTRPQIDWHLDLACPRF